MNTYLGYTHLVYQKRAIKAIGYLNTKMEINLKFPEKHGSTTMRIHSKVLSQ
jgi:hypothetical protein